MVVIRAIQRYFVWKNQKPLPFVCHSFPYDRLQHELAQRRRLYSRPDDKSTTRPQPTCKGVACAQHPETGCRARLSRQVELDFRDGDEADHAEREEQ